MSNFLISCGGTGGHLAPGIALAEGLVSRGHNCTLVVSTKKVDSRIISNYNNLDFYQVSGSGFYFDPIRLIKFFATQATGFFQSMRLIWKKKPHVVVAFGGFTSVGVVLAAALVGVPIVLHEANRAAGKATRLFSVFAERVYLPPGVQLKSLPPRTLRYAGLPVRKDVKKLNRKSICDKLGVSAENKRVLVLGGSQGASRLNKWVMDNFEKLAQQGVDVYCVTGLGKHSEGKLEYFSDDGIKVQAIFKSFVDNISEVLSISDLVVSRAGAGTIAELIRCNLPSILIPYPHASDKHQLKNALFHEMQGGGIVLKEEAMGNLYQEVINLIYNDWLLAKFQSNLERMNEEDSLSIIKKDLELIAIRSRGKEEVCYEELT